MSLLGTALDWALIPLEALIKSTGGSYPLSKACMATNKSLRPKLSASKVAQTPFNPKDIFATTASAGKIKGRIETVPSIMRPVASSKFFNTYRVRLERTICELKFFFLAGNAPSYRQRVNTCHSQLMETVDHGFLTTMAISTVILSPLSQVD